MLFEHQGDCPYCGQIILVACTIEDPDEDLIRELVEEKCDCEDARLSRGLKDTEARLQKIIDADSTYRGSDYGFPQETIEGIRGICRMILREQINKVTLTEKSGDVLRLIKDGNVVKFKRSTKLQMEL